jgi:hypothetical protein
MLLLAVVLLVVFGDVIFLGRCFFLRDLTTYHFPMKSVLHRIVYEGHFPLWDRTYAAGQPIAANPAYEVFYPPQWLIFLPDYFAGFRLHIAVHFFIAAIGMYLLLRSMDLREAAGAFGAITFALGGPLLSLNSLLPFFFAVSWIPLILLFARRALIEPNRRDIALAIFFFGLQSLIGEPITAMQTLALIGAYALYRAWRTAGERARAMGRNVAILLVIAVGGLAVAAVQLIPALDFSRDSERSAPFAFRDVVSWSMPPVRVLEIFYPALLRHVSDAKGTPVLGTLYNDHREPLLGDLYIGIAAAFFAVAGLLVGIRGAWLAFLVTIGAWLLALGDRTPLIRLLYELHLFRSLRYPEKFAIAAAVALTIWASVVFDALLSGDRRLRKTLLLLAVVWTIGGTLFALSTGTSPPGSVVTSSALRMTPMQEWSGHWLAILTRGVVMVALFAAVTGRRKLAPFLLMIFAAADLLFLQPELVPRHPAAFFSRPPLAAAQPMPAPLKRIYHQADWEWAMQDPTAESWFNGTSLSQYFWLVRNGLFPRTANGWSLPSVLDEDIDRTLLLPTVRLLGAVNELRRSGRLEWIIPIAAMSNAGYRTRFRPYTPEVGEGIRRNAAAMQPVDLVPLANQAESHQYYFADQIERITDEHDFAAKLFDRTWSRNAALVPFAPFAPAAAIVTGVEETWNDARITVRSSGHSYFVASVTPDRHWRITVDGKRALSQVTNVGYQGVELGRGDHVIEMHYRNPSIWLGGAITMLALIGVVKVSSRSRAQAARLLVRGRLGREPRATAGKLPAGQRAGGPRSVELRSS